MEKRLWFSNKVYLRIILFTDRGGISIHGELVEVGVLKPNLGEDAGPGSDDASVEVVREGEGVSDQVADVFEIGSKPDFLQQNNVVFGSALKIGI